MIVVDPNVIAYLFLRGDLVAQAAQRVLELARDGDRGACDCEFVSVAVRLGVRLLTADEKVLKACPRHTAAFSAA